MRLNWKAFFFLLTLSAVTIWVGYMLLYVWQPDWLFDSPRGRSLKLFFWPYAFLMSVCTIWSLFVESDKK